jgi:hypothetical protein
LYQLLACKFLLYVVRGLVYIAQYCMHTTESRIRKCANVVVSRANSIRIIEPLKSSTRTLASRIRDPGHNCITHAVFRNREVAQSSKSGGPFLHSKTFISKIVAFLWAISKNLNILVDLRLELYYSIKRYSHKLFS